MEDGTNLPRLLLRLRGVGGRGPAVVSFRCDGVGLYGEKGTSVPSFSCRQLSLRAEVVAELPVEFRPVTATLIPAAGPSY